jgi:hypothetical protein
LVPFRFFGYLLHPARITTAGENMVPSKSITYT